LEAEAADASFAPEPLVAEGEQVVHYSGEMAVVWAEVVQPFVSCVLLPKQDPRGHRCPYRLLCFLFLSVAFHPKTILYRALVQMQQGHGGGSFFDSAFRQQQTLLRPRLLLTSMSRVVETLAE
jgi:hypothetical protein